MVTSLTMTINPEFLRTGLPAITQAYNEAMEREAERAMKKPAGKETLSEEMQEEAE